MAKQRAAKIALLGFAMQMTESIVLHHAGIATFGTQSFLSGTIPFAVGTFLFCKSLPVQLNFTRVAASLGRVSLGVYCLHLICILFVPPGLWPTTALQSLCLAVETAFLSTVISLAFVQINLDTPIGYSVSACGSERLRSWGDF